MVKVQFFFCVGRFWWGQLRGKRPLERSGRGWENDIKMEFQEIGSWGGGGVGLIWLRVGNTVMNLWVSYSVGNCLPSGGTIRFSRRTLLKGVVS
jgi:hypothetical protein